MRQIKFIQTLGFAVLFVASALPATGQQSWGWDVNLQGGFLWRKQHSAPTAAEVVDITGPTYVGTESIVATKNWTGGAAIRRRLDASSDFGLAYSGIFSTETQRSFSSVFPVTLVLPGAIGAPISSAVGGFAVDARTKARQHVMDFDFGFGADGAGPKIFAGMRFAYFTQATRIDLPQAFFPVGAEFSHRRDDRFIGAGPRLRGQWTHTVAEGWNVIAGVDGSVLFGSQRFRTSTTGFGGVATGDYKEEHARVVYNAGGELAVSRAWTNGLYLVLGYQASAWFGLRDNRRELDAANTLAAGAGGTNLLPGGRRFPIDLTHGPFLRFGLRM